MSLSPNIKKVAENSKDAHTAVKTLQTEMETDLAAAKTEFEARIDDSLKKARVTDGRLIQENQEMKVEFKSEFSLDKIAEVINKSLLAVIESTDPTTPAPSLSPDALRAYTAVVSSVAEAAKSSSTVSSSLSYSMTPLGPGLFAFLYATASSIHDERLFGTEEVSATAIFYRIVESIEDVQHGAAFDEALSNRQLIKTWTALRVDFAKQFGERKITRHEWADMDSLANKQIEEAKKALARANQPELESLSGDASDANKTADVVDAVLLELRNDADNVIGMLEKQDDDTSAAIALLRTFQKEGA